MAEEAKRVIWTPEAEEDFRRMTGYLIDHWAGVVSDQFADAILKTVDRLRHMPYSGVGSEGLSSVRQVVIKPYCKLYYTVVSEVIIILNLKDSRQRPAAF